jgi:hypothetical protein
MSKLSGEYAGQEQKEQAPQERASEMLRLPPKLVQVVQSRKVWAGVIGLVTTGVLWALGEIDGAKAVEALSWVLGIFIGSVALEDGMTRFFGMLVYATASHEPEEAKANLPGEGKKEQG